MLAIDDTSQADARRMVLQPGAGEIHGVAKLAARRIDAAAGDDLPGRVGPADVRFVGHLLLRRRFGRGRDRSGVAGAIAGEARVVHKHFEALGALARGLQHFFRRLDRHQLPTSRRNERQDRSSRILETFDVANDVRRRIRKDMLLKRLQDLFAHCRLLNHSRLASSRCSSNVFGSGAGAKSSMRWRMSSPRYRIENKYARNCSSDIVPTLYSAPRAATSSSRSRQFLFTAPALRFGLYR